MSLRDKPYLPLYIQDFITDEKLIECSAAATGVYIRLMCLMHKSKRYGTILLKQKDKQNVKQNINFAHKLVKQLPYTYEVILSALDELISEEVLEIKGDYLIQSRMVEDNRISDLRSESGKKGGEKTSKKFASSKSGAKTDIDNESKSDNESNKEKEELIFPYSSQDFMDVWNILVQQKKWRNKTHTALQASLKLLSDVPEEDAIVAIVTAISGNYQGIFPKKIKRHEGNSKGQLLRDSIDELKKRYSGNN